MKLYVWYGLESLYDWTHGVACAMASSKEEAIEVILASRESNKSLAKEIRTSEPTEVFDEPAGFWLQGGA